MAYWWYVRPWIKIEGYDLFRSDRVGRKCGGTALYLKSDLNSKVMLQYSNGTVKILVFKVKCMDTIFVTMYRPPNTQNNDWFNAVEA